MGWTFHGYNSPQTHREEKAEIEKLCTWECDKAVRRPVQTSKVGGVWYVAIKVVPKVGQGPTVDATYVTDPDGSYTFCEIFLTSRNGGKWGYKDMTESCGPNEAKAPLSLIKRLSNIHDATSYATQWRDACKAHAQSKPPALRAGDVIKTRPIALTNGSSVQSFRVDTYRQKRRNHKVFFSLENGGTYRLQRQHLVGLEIISRA